MRRCRSGAARCGQSRGRRVRRRGRSSYLAVTCPNKPCGDGRRYRPGRGRPADPAWAPSATPSARAGRRWRPALANHTLTLRFSLKLAALGVAPAGPRTHAARPPSHVRGDPPRAPRSDPRVSRPRVSAISPARKGILAPAGGAYCPTMGGGVRRTTCHPSRGACAGLHLNPSLGRFRVRRT